jgi:hypothetical protein
LSRRIFFLDLTGCGPSNKWEERPISVRDRNRRDSYGAL